jgi:hypothetical protein
MSEMLQRVAGRLCRLEWENVNDPPCHPGDANWRPCPICEPRARAALEAMQEPTEAVLGALSEAIQTHECEEDLDAVLEKIYRATMRAALHEGEPA